MGITTHGVLQFIRKITRHRQIDRLLIILCFPTSSVSFLPDTLVLDLGMLWFIFSFLFQDFLSYNLALIG